MDNVLIVVEDLERMTAFFKALGLVVEGEARVGGPDVGGLIGLPDPDATLVVLRSPDGGVGIELDRFHTPAPVRWGPPNPPVNALGLRRVMFEVDDMEATLGRVVAGGAEVIGEMEYRGAYRLAYLRGPEGVVVALSEALHG